MSSKVASRPSQKKSLTPVDPIEFVKLLWPDVYLTREQRQILRSLRDNDETVVPAANAMGKDFVSALGVIWFFMSRHPCRVVTTSAKDDHLRVLWGEIGNFIQSAKYPLRSDQGGPILHNQRELRKIYNGQKCEISYVVGMVASPDKIAAMQGHHVGTYDIPKTLFVSDESSSVPDDYHKMAGTWAKRILVIGNTWPCANFFYRAVKGRPGTDDHGGDLPRPDGNGFIRKVIHIRADSSPNVRLGLAQVAAGLTPTNEVLVPGVRTYADYVKYRKIWDPIQQCVSLDAEFYEGAEVRLYPKEWLDRAVQLAVGLQGVPRRAKSMGVDPAEGGDSTAFTIVDEQGVIFHSSEKTPNTVVVSQRIKEYLKRFKLEPEDVWMDRGGGGKQHADYLREAGYNVNTVGFGEAASDHESYKRRHTATRSNESRKDSMEVKQFFKNRRAEMYGLLRYELLDPDYYPSGFAIPGLYTELIRQLSPLPLMFDDEGKLIMPPKNNKKNPNYKGITIEALLGCSPDAADSLVLAVFGMLCKPQKREIGAMW